ncbi:TPA: pyrroline-5-carboxylate reductase [Clostridioides difficile]|nr:pyrroline-5-carboxylate reductase [Clostridioides difficile]EGT5136002.1 pyrroline-5-carboxylate reductase [Clostridioides difficile]EGT5283126.1 pyrroline-5-carboxylate reductase [Clostridioides difficile]MBG0211092.1 pyrroline-5-carboxylate reductase [Clostridioides difficile]MBY1738190.1 pyrroline-5-carboxylate reductase [Clostridioides difficile]
MKTLGFIGSGNMGSAMIGGIVQSRLVKAEDITVSDLSQVALDKVKEEFGVNTTTDSKVAVTNSDVVIVALKPNICEKALTPLKELIDANKIIVSIAAGKTIESLESFIGSDKKIVRVMPNTPALVGEGMSALCKNSNVTDEELNMIKALFESFGEAEIVSEYLMDTVTGISGSSPAYVFMFIEAMADAAVLAGMPRQQAYKFASQAVMGSAKMVLETGKHPGELKDMVCSPAGTTIEAVKVLEEEGFRAAVIKSIVACIDKSKDMSK